MRSQAARIFLRQFKQALVRGDWEIVQRRAKYAQVTEMSPAMIKRTLLRLTPDNYVKGPEADRNRHGEYLWVFFKDDATTAKLYIKLKILNGHAKVISFHRSLYA